jgi:hypothetical protein
MMVNAGTNTHQGLLVKLSSTTNIQDVFIYTLFIATCFGLSDGHPQANRTKY